MKKVTEEEFQEIQNLRNSLFAIMATIGEMHLNKIMLQEQIKNAGLQIEEQETKFKEFQEAERVLFEKLQQKYGTSTIDVDTGEIKE